MTIVNKEAVKEFQTFSSITELDQTVRGYLFRHKYTFLPSTEKVLKCIWRNAGDVYGVCDYTLDKIETEVKLSRKQVDRAINQLIRLNIIERILTPRDVGKRLILLVIQPDMDYTKFSKEEEMIGLSSLERIPKDFIDFGTSYFSEEKVRQLWAHVLEMEKNSETDIPLGELLDEVISALIDSTALISGVPAEVREKLFYQNVEKLFHAEKKS
ncbi:hypothetical protein ACWE42_12020 [Sutcliffiella cohnii]